MRKLTTLPAARYLKCFKSWTNNQRTSQRKIRRKWRTEPSNLIHRLRVQLPPLRSRRHSSSIIPCNINRNQNNSRQLFIIQSSCSSSRYLVTRHEMFPIGTVMLLSCIWIEPMGNMTSVVAPAPVAPSHPAGVRSVAAPTTANKSFKGPDPPQATADNPRCGECDRLIV